MSKQNKSPFHKGEKTIQENLGVRDRMEKFGRMLIRDHMPKQQRDFYCQLPYILLGHADRDGNPWASIIFKSDGLISSSDDKHLEILAMPMSADPLIETLSENGKLNVQTRLGILGIDLASRRRNRLSAHVLSFSDEEIKLEIDQAFGNCPQYIQGRDLQFIAKNEYKAIEAQDITELDESSKQLIRNSDTFFIASYYEDNSSADSEGADVSHRGGLAGFVRVNNSHSLTIPDYSGNNHFNTLGNILETSKAGLLFIDFKTGDILMLTGHMDIIWDTNDLAQFDGAQRLLGFTLLKGRYIKNAVPV